MIPKLSKQEHRVGNNCSFDILFELPVGGEERLHENIECLFYQEPNIYKFQFEPNQKQNKKL